MIKIPFETNINDYFGSLLNKKLMIKQKVEQQIVR